MKRFLAASALCALVLTAGRADAAGITINVYTALAPNAYGSPSYTAWQTNAIASMEAGITAGTPTGTPGTPTYFQTQTDVTSAQAVVTGFPSWMGTADPGTVYGSAFANELGNRMMFPLWIDGGGLPFSIADLGFTATSTDPFNALAFAYGPGSYTYSAGYVGLNYGGDGAKGGGDDVWITSGANTQLVNELFGRGSGNSFAAYCTGCTIEQQQAEIDATAAYPGTDFTFTGTYYLTSGAQRLAEGSGTFNVTAPVPEPGSMILLGTGLLGTIARRRSKKKSA
jgi:hypothetical protein